MSQYTRKIHIYISMLFPYNTNDFYTHFSSFYSFYDSFYDSSKLTENSSPFHLNPQRS